MSLSPTRTSSFLTYQTSSTLLNTVLLGAAFVDLCHHFQPLPMISALPVCPVFCPFPAFPFSSYLVPLLHFVFSYPSAFSEPSTLRSIHPTYPVWNTPDILHIVYSSPPRLLGPLTLTLRHLSSCLDFVSFYNFWKYQWVSCLPPDTLLTPEHLIHALILKPSKVMLCPSAFFLANPV